MGQAKRRVTGNGAAAIQNGQSRGSWARQRRASSAALMSELLKFLSEMFAGMNRCSCHVLLLSDSPRFRRSSVLVIVRPLKTDPPLIVDPDAVLALAIARQRLETVSWQCCQVLKEMGGFDTIELESGRPLNPGECLYPFAGGEVSRSLVAIADDHRDRSSHIVTRYVTRNDHFHEIGGIRSASRKFDPFEKLLASLCSPGLLSESGVSWRIDFVPDGPRRAFHYATPGCRRAREGDDVHTRIAREHRAESRVAR